MKKFSFRVNEADEEDNDKIDNAIEAMCCIFDMFMPNWPSALTAMGAFVGACMWKVCDEDKIESFLKTLNEHATQEFHFLKESSQKLDLELEKKRKFGH